MPLNQYVNIFKSVKAQLFDFRERYHLPAKNIYFYIKDNFSGIFLTRTFAKAVGLER